MTGKVGKGERRRVSEKACEEQMIPRSVELSPLPCDFTLVLYMQ